MVTLSSHASTRSSEEMLLTLRFPLLLGTSTLHMTRSSIIAHARFSDCTHSQRQESPESNRPRDLQPVDVIAVDLGQLRRSDTLRSARIYATSPVTASLQIDSHRLEEA